MATATKTRPATQPKPPPGYAEHLQRERTRREQAGYRQQAQREVAAERGDQPAYVKGAADKSTAAYQRIAAGKGLQGRPRTYHRIVLAEFAVAVIIVGASPILTPRPGATPGQKATDFGLSLAGPLVRLTAVCVVFFVLALMATGERAGKVAAAFGGLVVLGVLLNATQELSVLAGALSPPKPPSGLSAGNAAQAGAAIGNDLAGLAP